MKKRIILAMVSLVSLCSLAEAQGKAQWPVSYRRGYRADIQTGVVLNLNGPSYVMTTSHGYSFGNGIFIGAGTGLYVDTFAMGKNNVQYQIPVFAELKYNLTAGPVSPFVSVKAGGLYDCTLNSPGYMVRPSVGVDLWRVSISVGWDRTMYKYLGGMTGKSNVYIGLSCNF